jgi:hypothetical protein
MSTGAISTYRVAHESQIPFGVNVVTSVPRIESTGPDARIDDGCGAARGIFFGLLLCAPFWVGVYVMLF